MLPVINALEVQKGKPAMKKNITELENPRRRVARKNKQRELTIGVDLGDKASRYCVFDREGNVLFERSTATTKRGLAQAFANMGARSHRNGSGNTLALGEAAVRELESRSNRGQRAPGEADYGEHAQGRPPGCAQAGAAGTRRSGVVIAYSAPE